jgi:hypothetical protein
VYVFVCFLIPTSETTDLHEPWCERYYIGVHSLAISLNTAFSIVNNNMEDAQRFEVELTQAPRASKS